MLILSGVGHFHKGQTEILITKILILSNITYGLSKVVDLIGFVTYLLGANLHRVFPPHRRRAHSLLVIKLSERKIRSPVLLLNLHEGFGVMYHN